MCAATLVSQTVASVLPTALPTFEKNEALSEAHMVTFLAFADAIMPGIVPDTKMPKADQLAIPAKEYQAILDEVKRVSVNADIPTVEKLLSEGCSSNAAFRSSLDRVMSIYAPEDIQSQILLVMNLLNSRLGAFITTGHFTPFHLQPINKRIEILKGWNKAHIEIYRAAIKSLQLVVRNLYIKTNPTIYAAIQHPSLSEEGQAGESYEFKFEEFPKGQDIVTLYTDAVIVGSGCGAGVVAKNLAEDGHDVIVVEKAWNVKAQYLPMTDLDASVHLYENGQVLPSDDGSIAGVYAGSTWGGGGAVNWSACLQVQGFVRREWAAEGMTFFEEPEFQESNDRVWNNMGAHTDKIEHNHGNRVLMEGARRLGYAYKPVAQNTGGKRHWCGHCGHGCRLAEKGGPNNLWFPQAAAAPGKTRFIQGFEVKEVLFDPTSRAKKAVGVRAVWTARDEHNNFAYSRNVVIKAKKVVLSAGSLWSPVLLLKSGINSHPVGRNLHLHPATIIFGVFKEPTKPCEGGILTSVVSEFERLDGAHGAKLEATSMLPSNCLSTLPWNDPVEWKSLILKHPHMNAYISMVRDRDSGRVYADAASGKPKVQYTVSEFDKKHALEGSIAIAKILYDQGALEIHTCTTGVKPYIRNSDPVLADNEFKEWQAHVRTFGLPFPESTFATAHQMGSCRMGMSPTNSVVDTKGKVWGVEHLYIMDASVFPSASGVNPMVTNMAISDRNSRLLSKELKAWK